MVNWFRKNSKIQAEKVTSEASFNKEDTERMYLVKVFSMGITDWKTRRDYAERLSAYTSDDVIETLFNAVLNDPEWPVRFTSAKSLGVIGQKASGEQRARIVDVLIKALSDEQCTVIEYAAEALGKIGDEKAIDPLLVTLGYKSDFAPCEASAKALSKFGSRVTLRLIDCLNDREKTAGAIMALGIIQDKDAMDPLLSILTNESYPIGFRIRVASVIGNFNDKKAVEPLTTILTNTTDGRLVDSVSQALQKLGANPIELKKQVDAANKKAGAQLLEALLAIKAGLSESELITLVGQPKFETESSAAFESFGWQVPDAVKGKQNWVFSTKYGDFQTVMLATPAGRVVVETPYLQTVISKLKADL